MTVAEWLRMVKADAERRGGPELVAALEGLAKATEALRAGDWNRDHERDQPREGQPREEQPREDRPREGQPQEGQPRTGSIANVDQRGRG